jgi:TonB family protein
VSAGFASTRFGAALGASLLAHAALLGALGSLPAAPQARAQLAQLGDRLLTATLLGPQVEAPKPAPRAVPAVRGAAALPAPHYYAPEELDERPLILQQVEPQWPDGVTPGAGHVRLQIYVGEHGRVDAVEILESYPSGAFDAAAKEAFTVARFRPGMRSGTPVKSLVRLELLFGTSLPIDPRASRSVEGERAPLANPNAADAPDRAGIKLRAPRQRSTPKETS